MTGREAARFALDAAGRKGLSAEAFYSSSSELEVRCFRGEVEHFERADAGGLGLRVVADGRAGCAYTEDLSRESVEETLAAAAEIAGHLEPQEGVELSDWPAAAEVPGLECPEIAGCPVEKKIDMVCRMEAAARAVGAEVANVPWAGYGETVVDVFVANTAGLERGKRLGSAQLFVQALAARGQDAKTFSEHCFARRLSELDPKRLGRAAGEGAVGLLGAAEPASGRRNVLFSPRSFAGTLAAFSPVFSGRSAEEGRSPLAGRLGHKVGAEGVFLSDDATLPANPASRPFDAEGVPARRLPVIEGGVFRAFMHTSDTARRAGVGPTGHAVRSYKAGPSVAPSNFFLPAGGDSPGKLRAGADIEIVELTGFHSAAHPVSGDFSLPALGYALRNGLRAEPLHNFTVAGNFLELLGAIRAAGSDFEYGIPGMGSAFGSGSVLVGGLSVAGRG